MNICKTYLMYIVFSERTRRTSRNSSCHLFSLILEVLSLGSIFHIFEPKYDNAFTTRNLSLYNSGTWELKQKMNKAMMTFTENICEK